jgi:5,5'-dehydrodivanillate O-demethylase oxygenase subunit
MSTTHNASANHSLREARKPRPIVDLATTKPGTPGGIFMRQFWHAITRSEDLLPGKTMPIRIMNENYTLFRGTNGRAQIFAERCPHRGALLHLGWVGEETLRCVYHGWEYDYAGQCIEAPAERAGFEKNVRVPVFPTGEAYGLIYGFFGDDEPPAFPPYPESHGEGIIDARPVERVPCNYLQSFENSMDEVHVAYTHSPGGSHAALAHDLPLITAEETDWGMMRFGKRPSGEVRHTLHIAPNIVRVIVPPPTGMDGVGGWPEITFHFTPVDDENQLWIRTAKFPVTGADADSYWQKRVDFYEQRETAPDVNKLAEDIWAGRIAYADVRHPELAVVQDIAVQAGQGRITNRKAETLGRSDAGIAVWRRILERELQIIATGGRPKTWRRLPVDIIPTLGIQESVGAHPGSDV